MEPSQGVFLFESILSQEFKFHRKDPRHQIFCSEICGVAFAMLSGVAFAAIRLRFQRRICSSVPPHKTVFPFDT